MAAAAATRQAMEGSPQQLAWAAGALLLGGLPHLLAVAPWIPLLLLGCGLWRIGAAQYGWPLPALWIRIPLAVLGFLAVAISYRSISGIQAGSALLLVMGAMKLLETRNQRDRMVLIFISLFLLFAAFLREQAIGMLAWLVAGTLGISAALLQTARQEGLLPTSGALRLATRLLVQGLPLAVVLFILFPRLPGPFWSLPDKASSGISGLSEQIRPGDISALGLSDAIAFRARFRDGTPPAGALYWRGPVLEHFDGRGWSVRQSPASGPPAPVATDGVQYNYELVLEPQGGRWLLALETPLQWSAPRARLGPAMELRNTEPIHDRLSYRARSAIGGSVRTVAGADMLAANLQLPAGRNPRTLELATRLRAGSTDDRDYLQRLLQLFHEQPFRYSLKPPLLGAQPVDEFLFDTRSGFCEHYASALAVLARAAGIPARVVAGYQGGEHNPIGDYWIIRQAHAHAWVEAWIDGTWQRIDPTAAVAPERIERGIEEILAASPGGMRLWRSSRMVGGMVLSWDAVNAAWDRWVLAFGPEAQERLLRGLGFRVPQPLQLALLAGAAASLCLVLLAWLGGRRRQGARDRLHRLYDRLCRRLAAATGRPRHPGETPSAYASVVAGLRPDLAAETRTLTALYLQLRYGGSGDARDAAAFSRRLQRFRPARAPAARDRR